MTALRTVAIIVGLMASLVFQVRALSHLSELGRANQARVMALGMLTKRQYFTRTGWRHLWIGRILGFVTLLFGGYLLVLG